jgi:hypothetical protein
MRSRVVNIWTLAIVFAVAWGCRLPGGHGAGGGGTLVLSLSARGVLVARTIQPEVGMTIGYYDIHGTGPGGATFQQLGVGSSTVVQASLVPGSWSVLVEAFNSDSPAVQIGEGVVTLNVVSGQVVNEQVSVQPLEGEGTLEVLVSWPAGVLSAPVTGGTLTAVGGSGSSMSFAAQTNAARFVAEVPRGYYLVSVQLSDGGSVVWGTVEAARLVAGSRSFQHYELVEDINRGGGAVTIVPELGDPIGITLGGAVAVLEQGQLMSVTVTPSQTVDSYQWYLNGVAIAGASGASVSVGAGLGLGFYWLDVVVTRGATLGSARHRFQVVDLLPDTTAPVFGGLVSATTLSASSIRLGWAAAVDDTSAAGGIVYLIYSSAGAGGESFGSPSASTAAGVTSYDVTGLVSATTYFFVVRAEDEAGNRDANTVERSAMTAAPTFAVRFNPSTANDEARSMALDSGYLYAVGYDSAPGNGRWHIQKRDATTGALVAAFGSGGVVTADPSVATDVATSVVVDSSYLYAAGYASAAGGVDHRWRIEKRNKITGVLVPAFGSAGIVASNPSTAGDTIEAMVADSSNLYVAGYDTPSGSVGRWRIEKRSKATGALVTSFGSGGAVAADPSIGFDRVTSLCLDATYLYVIGFDSAGGSFRWRLEKRLITSGALVGSFGSGGVVVVGAASPRAGVVDESYLYVAGSGGGQFRVEKRDKSTGSLVGAFGQGGVVLSDYGPGSDSALSIAMDAASVYVAGQSSFADGLDSQWRIERRDKTTGALINDFGTGGIVSSNPSVYTDTPYVIGIDDLSLYVGGIDSLPGNNDREWRFEKRRLDTGGF